MKINTYPVQWTKEKVSQFFDFYSSQPHIEENYFSKQRGKAVIQFVKKWIANLSNTLDYGCGPGYFLDYLLGQGISSSGADISEVSIKKLKNRVSDHPLFQNAFLLEDHFKLPVESHFFDNVFLLEVIEHLVENDAKDLFAEIHRVLKPNGHIIITTPYKENLAHSQVTCPNCACQFHQVQHIHSFTKEKLSEQMMRYNFEPLICKTTLLLPDFKTWLNARKYRKNWTHCCPDCKTVFTSNDSSQKIKSLLGTLKEIQHLIYIGKKINEC